MKLLKVMEKRIPTWLSHYCCWGNDKKSVQIILSFYLQISLVSSTGQLWNILSKKNSIGPEADVHAVVKPLHE